MYNTKKHLFFIVVALAAVLMLLNIYNPAVVNAGMSKKYSISEVSVVGDHINSGDFFITDGIHANDSRIVFDGNTTDDISYFATTSKIQNLKDYGMDNLFSFEGKMIIDKLENNGKVMMVFGFNSLRKVREYNDSFVICFSKGEGRHGVDIEMFEKTENGTIKVVMERHYVAEIVPGQPFSINVDSDCNNIINISFNNKVVLKNYKSTADLSGYFSTLSYGKNLLNLFDMTLIGYYYEVAENVDYVETFDNGEYNANVFYTYGTALEYFPCHLNVNKDGQLEFKNVFESYIATMYEYSNFELEFDIIDMVSQNKVDENGNIIAPASARLGIGIGKNNHATASFYEHMDLWLQIQNDVSNPYYAVLENFKGAGYKSFSDIENNFDFWNEKFIDGRVVKVKFTMIDGIMKLYYRFDGEYPYTPDDFEYDESDKAFYDYKCYYSYDTGKSTPGYVKIFSYGTMNYKMDNLSIKNLDYIEVRNSLSEEIVGFKSNKMPGANDFNYDTVTDDNDLIENKLSADYEQSGCNQSVMSVENISVFAIITAISLILLCVRRKKS